MSAVSNPQQQQCTNTITKDSSYLDTSNSSAGTNRFSRCSTSSDDENENNELRIISIEELKAFEGLSGLSDKQALEIINSLKELSLITHKIIHTYE